MLKNIIYLIFALATVFYAILRIPILSYEVEARLFSIIWLFFALLVIGAQLERLLDYDEKKQKNLMRLKKYQLWKQEQNYLRNKAQVYKQIKDYN
ncbi:hypothetical protein BHF71_06375 [Vulcanibacillus modesticaldus]|uniref:Uncharacterized protein n=1 Tax=Vulcanibacillus modesticaldus TaxID=337097 RepID=A0A1D2YWM8_9BACI|nr:hypothetical protein [Vulcanibacillus modesticaldus]OEG00068.1 hypothetical protein BHF71_06375 [Vulcanibacillus modesticaldus]